MQRRWGDVHSSLCVGIRGEIQPKLPPGLLATSQEEVWLEEDASEGRTKVSRFNPDVFLTEITDTARQPGYTATVATVAPLIVRRLGGVQRRLWVQIVDSTDHNRIVTAIEVLSPGNKLSGRLNREYRAKVEAYIEAGVNVVELDLVRSSRKRLDVPDRDFPPDRRTAYYTCVNRAAASDVWEVYPMPLRDPLPTVPIPLRSGEKDVPLSLQPVIDRIYVEGGHYNADYSKPPEPPLPVDDQEWAGKLIETHPAK